MRDSFPPIRQLGRRRSMSGSRSRMFGLDASDRTRLVKNSDSEAEGGGNPTVNPCQQLLITKLTRHHKESVWHGHQPTVAGEQVDDQ